MMKVSCPLTVSIASLAWVTVAAAQTPAAGSGVARRDQASATPDALEEIIVTAQKREELLSDVPMSITAVTGDQLARIGVSSVADLVKVTPGLTVATTSVSTPIYTIRGIGFYENSMAIAPTVSVYTDQIPLPYSVMTEGVVLDVQRVEVLKGPQGTLFGQNSTGGAINFIPNKPTNTFQAGAELGYGNYNAVTANGYVSGPLADTLSVRVAGSIERRDAWQISQTRPGDTLGKRDFSNGRVLLNWRPVDALTLQLNVNGWVNKSDSQAGAFLAFKPTIPAAFGGYTDHFAELQAYPVAAKNSRVADWNQGSDYARDDNFYQIALRGDLELGDTITLTSISSYSKLKRNALTDGDGTNISQVDTRQLGFIKALSQELRLSGTNFDNRLQWIIGGNYANDKSDEHQIVHVDGSNSGLGPFRIHDMDLINNQDIKTAAAFGSLDYSLTDTLTLQGSARYTESKNDQESCVRDINGDLATAFSFAVYGGAFIIPQGQCVAMTITPTGPAPTLTLFPNSLDEHNVSWRTGLSWKPSKDLLVYANVTRGYKAGAYSTLPAAAVIQLRPVTQESVLAYEAGFKAQLANRMADLSMAVFHYDYSDKQLRGYVSVPPFGNLPGLVSIPKSKVDGAELSFAVRPVKGLTFNIGTTYIKSKVTRDFSTPNPDGVVVNVNGEAFPFTPKWQVTGDMQYEFPVADSVNAYVGISPRYQSSSVPAFGSDASYDISGYTILDARAGVTSSDDRWRVEVWGSNVTNKFYVNNIVHVIDDQVRFSGMPVTYGVRAGYKF